jgi:hypothetical protein
MPFFMKMVSPAANAQRDCRAVIARRHRLHLVAAHPVMLSLPLSDDAQPHWRPAATDQSPARQL